MQLIFPNYTADRRAITFLFQGNQEPVAFHAHLVYFPPVARVILLKGYIRLHHSSTQTPPPSTFHPSKNEIQSPFCSPSEAPKDLNSAFHLLTPWAFLPLGTCTSGSLCLHHSPLLPRTFPNHFNHSMLWSLSCFSPCFTCIALLTT